MQNSNAYNTYKNNSINYASKEQLLLMLLDGAVRFSKIARQSILDNDVKKAHENIIKTQDIFYELIASLDVNKGGEWAKNLIEIYDFIIRKLIESNIKKDAGIMDEIIPLIEDVRDTWNEAYKAAKSYK
ncbi:flagellar protein FliS [Clostridium sp. USBA 49]|jgi:flagellar protein FliS|uniref:flagellar export chaperone FliS n=1 Tax=Clostridium TaxID=1485 RepID=UPI0009994BF3|nr:MULTISPECIES: flagellar export chaperone FliS [Clostridium]SKA72710.1 flagellar protein FliS [Clostridium sp. USBA 49]